jgi:Flp pilus assembly protein TadB
MGNIKMFVIGVAIFGLLGLAGAFVWIRHNKQHQDNTQTLAASTTTQQESAPESPNTNKQNGVTMEPNQGTNQQQTPANQTPTVDPSTFSQYDKYKDGKAAMFAEVQAGTGAELTSGKTAVVVYKG